MILPFNNAFFFLSVFVLNCCPSFSQSLYIYLERDLISGYEQLLNAKNNYFHSSVKPYLLSETNLFIHTDSIHQAQDIIRRFISRRKSARKDSLPIQTSLRQIEIAPVFSLNWGYESSDTVSQKVSGTAIGLSFNADIGHKLAARACYLASNASYPSHITDYIKQHEIVPGEGYATDTKLGYYHQNFTGYISYSPYEFINLQAGQGKNFLGDGYRSLLLSDVANNYPFIKSAVTIWKIKYVNLFANFKDIRGSSGNYNNYKDKFATFHYLSWNATRRFNIGLFESVIWQGKDTLNNRGFDVNYLNPVIFYRPVEYSLGSSDNVLMGMNLKLKLTNNILLYGQVIIDEFLLDSIKSNNGWWANKYGGQAGVKYFDLFRIKRLSLQAEYNMVRPYTYSHGSTQQNYGHFNQPLAHPSGANFKETLGIIRYQHNSFSVEAKMLYVIFGKDSGGVNFGGDIYKSYSRIPHISGNYITQGALHTLLISELKTCYLFDTRTNLRAEISLQHRIQTIESFRNTTFFIQVGLRTALYNLYRDFM